MKEIFSLDFVIGLLVIGMFSIAVTGFAVLAMFTACMEIYWVSIMSIIIGAILFYVLTEILEACGCL